ncbi:hypothetical protein K3L72_10220 [Bacillus altitudinis]|uniref:Uncharacterized protein n=1 Tax=Bacillus altitudinis TaxID=293387 RepID=A0ABV1S2K6_BACAB|nr:hypothetical protein [Bacillus altitudinis]MBY0186474.1 hypothetical protein [Bacillus aerophilus]MCW4358154.1 hypothetical protein [Bacillus altitudinis]MCY7579352.1 hypothetical protein [Bacillus altitudinis]MCY7594663.1 hypothetical protein [Bacillus altitudinis]WJE31539.1 hypothetical protein QRD87_06585 [Bacillus altitudinis]
MRSTLKENKEIKEFRKQKFTKQNLKHNLVELSSRGLIVYITENFPRDGQDYLEHKKKMMILKSLDTEDISAAIARMDRINHVNDQKRFFFFIGAMSTIIAVALGNILGNIEFDPNASSLDNAATIVMICIIPIFIYLMFSWAVIMDSINKATVYYFKDLLIQAKDEKKNDIEIV